jgi:methyl-accepting chemotaxis protein
MGLWNSVKAWVKREASDLKEATDDLEQQLDADLSRREEQLDETPQESVERLQAEIEQGDSAYAELGDKISQAAARAAAASEVSRDGDEVDADGMDPDDLDRAPET